MSFALPMAAYLAGLVASVALLILAVWELQRLILGN
jgi:hypothetical protein